VKACSASMSRRLRHILQALALLFIGAFLFSTGPSVQAQSASTPRPSSASIRTPDFDESVQWYQDKLGFRLLGSQSLVPGRRAVMERSGFLLEINEADHILPSEPDTTATVQVTKAPVVSVLVPDVDREIERLRKAGVEVLQNPEDELDGRFRTAQIRDNGRHRIELREPIDENGFNAMGR
jgi:catechol 2,3-dioxygenase-like lactoylglutathione lyase family enzyme